MDTREREREMDWGREKGRDRRAREREGQWEGGEREGSFYFTLITCLTSHQQ